MLGNQGFLAASLPGIPVLDPRFVRTRPFREEFRRLVKHQDNLREWAGPSRSSYLWLAEIGPLSLRKLQMRHAEVE